MEAFALGTEDGDELHRGVHGAESVRSQGGELHRLTGRDVKVVVAEDEPEPAVEDVQG